MNFFCDRIGYMPTQINSLQQARGADKVYKTFMKYTTTEAIYYEGPYDTEGMRPYFDAIPGLKMNPKSR